MDQATAGGAREGPTTGRIAADQSVTTICETSPGSSQAVTTTDVLVREPPTARSQWQGAQ